MVFQGNKFHSFWKILAVGGFVSTIVVYLLFETSVGNVTSIGPLINRIVNINGNVTTHAPTIDVKKINSTERANTATSMFINESMNTGHVTTHKPPSTDVKNILLWTKFWNEKWVDKMGQDAFSGCEESRCSFTDDKSAIDTVDALLVHYNDARTTPWPKVRRPDLLYALFVIEPPGITGRVTDLSEFNNIIDIIISYRQDADIYTPYGEFAKRKTPVNYTAGVPFKSKSKSVVWSVSNCRTPSERQVFVKELAKHIDVDVYGACGRLKCPKTNWGQCMRQFESKYRFYLALENSLCRDYVTEKTFSPLGLHIIPVVLGGANYSVCTPPHSVINVMDFDSPQALAKYLNMLSNNEKEYNKYFEWKQSFLLDGRHPTTKGICRLCKYVHQKERPPKRWVNNDIAKWWQGNGICNNDWVSRHLG